MNMKESLFVFLSIIFSLKISCQTFPNLNASAGNKNEFIIDSDSNIIMFHSSKVEKLDKHFNPIWVNSYSGLEIKNLLLSKTGSLFFISNSFNGSALIDRIGKIEANGTLTWSKELPTFTAVVSGNTQTVTIDNADHLLLDRNNQLVISGVSTHNGGLMYLLKLDTLGNFIKLKTITNGYLLDPKSSIIVSDVSGYYTVSSWGYGFEGPVYNLIYKFNDLTNSITSDSLFTMSYMGMTNQYPSSNEHIIKSKMESNTFYLCNNTGAASSQLNNTFSFRKIKRTSLQWGIQFQTSFPYLMSLQSIEEDPKKNVFLSVSCKNINTNKTDKWIVKIDSNGVGDTQKYNLLQNFGKATMSNEDSVTQLIHHYGNNYIYTIESRSTLTGPLSVIKMDSTIGSYCSPTATINISSNGNYSYAFGSASSTSLTSVPTVSMQTMPSTLASVLNYSVITSSCLALGTKELSEGKVSGIYPNPVQHILNINTFGMDVKEATIFDVAGKKVLSVIDQVHIDVSKLNPGLYFIKVITDSGEFSLKFIKE